MITRSVDVPVPTVVTIRQDSDEMDCSSSSCSDAGQLCHECDSKDDATRAASTECDDAQVGAVTIRDLRAMKPTARDIRGSGDPFLERSPGYVRSAPCGSSGLRRRSIHEQTPTPSPGARERRDFGGPAFTTPHQRGEVYCQDCNGDCLTRIGQATTPPSGNGSGPFRRRRGNSSPPDLPPLRRGRGGRMHIISAGVVATLPSLPFGRDGAPVHRVPSA